MSVNFGFEIIDSVIVFFRGHVIFPNKKTRCISASAFIDFIIPRAGLIVTRHLGSPANLQVPPANRSGGFKLVSHVFTNATGSQSITGVGFKPKALIVGWGFPSSTAGAIISQGRAVDGSPIVQNSEANYNLSTGQAVSNVSTTQAIFRIGGAATAAFAATVTSFDSDGITVNVTETEATASTRTFQILFLG